MFDPPNITYLLWAMIYSCFVAKHCLVWAVCTIYVQGYIYKFHSSRGGGGGGGKFTDISQYNVVYYKTKVS